MSSEGQVPTRSAELRDVRDHDEGPGEVAAVPSLSHLHRLGPQHNLQGAWDGTTRQLGLRLLDSHLNTQKPNFENDSVPSPAGHRNLTGSYLLEVNELGLVCVQVEASAVAADRVPADGRR